MYRQLLSHCLIVEFFFTLISEFSPWVEKWKNEMLQHFACNVIWIPTVSIVIRSLIVGATTRISLCSTLFAILLSCLLLIVWRMTQFRRPNSFTRETFQPILQTNTSGSSCCIRNVEIPYFPVDCKPCDQNPTFLIPSLRRMILLQSDNRCITSFQKSQRQTNNIKDHPQNAASAWLKCRFSRKNFPWILMWLVDGYVLASNFEKSPFHFLSNPQPCDDQILASKISFVDLVSSWPA